MNPWSTACPDWERRLFERRSLVPDLPLFTGQADRALRVFKRLRIPDLHGRPRMADACGPWVFPIVAAMFGSYDPDLQRRMIQEFFLMIPKKNAKSSTGGPLMLTALIVNERPEGEFNLIAPTIEIAKIAFKQAKGTIKADPELEKIFQIRDHIRTIEHRTMGSVLQIKAADTDVVTGGKALGTMIDETHVFAKKSNAADIFIELRGALAARPDGFLFQTTTQSKEAPSGVFKTELSNARAVRDGEIDLPLLPILYEYPERFLEENLWKDPANWSMVNPNLGRSVDEAFLRRELEKAERNGIEQMMLFASQHFNIEIGLRMRNDAWRGAQYFERAGDTSLTLESLLERCEVAVAGVDGGGLDDLYALCVAGRDRETREWLFWTRAWVQRDLLKLRPEIASKLEEFSASGDLVLCDDATQDILEIAAIIRQVADSGIVPDEHWIGVDPQAISALLDALTEIGLNDKQWVGVPQGFRLSSAVWGMERKLKDGTLRHNGSAMNNWCVSNAKAEQRGNAVYITKETAGKAKIDPLIAMFNAAKLLERNPVASTPNVASILVLG